MPSTASKPRRSPRLLGRALSRQQHEKNKQARKKRKKDSLSASISLLALPDEPLRLIFVYLGATKTGGSFSGPRHAFALAQTNTRLLRLFGGLLTSITPNNDCYLAPPTLGASHILSVIHVAGHALRKIDLPRDAFGKLPMICRACPRLEALSVVNDDNVEVNVLPDVLSLPLQALSISGPSRDHLDSLVPPPPALSLLELEYADLDKLELILRGPLTEFELVMTEHPPWLMDANLSDLMPCLRTAIRNIESVSVNVNSNPCFEEEVFPRVAAKCIDRARANEGDSKCMSLSLNGSLIFDLVSQAHRTAKIECKEGTQSFADDGKGIYAIAINADGNVFNSGYDFLRLQELYIFHPFNERWNEVLSGVRLKKVYCYPRFLGAGVSLSFETLETTYSEVSCKDWSWLGDARRVHLTTKGNKVLKYITTSSV